MILYLQQLQGDFFMIRNHKNKIIISGKPFFLVLGIVSVFIFILGACMLPGLSFKETVDIFASVFMLIWTGVIIYFILFSFNAFFKKIIIGEESVQCKTLFGTKEYMWSEINDFGITYSGKTKINGAVYDDNYCLYFSPEILRVKRNGNKKFNKSTCKIEISSKEKDEFINEVIPYCRKRSNINPYFSFSKFTVD